MNFTTPYIPAKNSSTLLETRYLAGCGDIVSMPLFPLKGTVQLSFQRILQMAVCTELTTYYLTPAPCTSESGNKFPNGIAYICNDLPMNLLYWLASPFTNFCLPLFNVEKNLVVTVT